MECYGYDETPSLDMFVSYPANLHYLFSYISLRIIQF
jgi:hypothetical protein